MITTRMPVADIADHEGTSALRRNLEQLSSDAGAKLLRALGVKGDEAELRSAGDEFSGHCLALTLLGSYLTDAYDGDIRCRSEVSGHLSHDVRQGVHARKVMESYQIWFGGSPEVSVLRMLGLFDRPADEKALETLLKPPAIPGLTESLTDLRPTEWQTILAKLRRARLLAGEDPHNPGYLDAHPLVREYFGEQLRNQQAGAWKECNRRLFHYYRTLAPQLPDSFGDMEPLFLAVTCGCHAGLFREALHEVYISRIQRGDTCFAAKVLGARAALLIVLLHFFEHERWDSPVHAGIEGQSLTAEDQLFILMEAALYLAATRGHASSEAYICNERLGSLCSSVNHPLILYRALIGQWRYSSFIGKLRATIPIGERVYSLAQEQNDAALMIGAYNVLACTHYYLGDIATARQYTMRGVQIWRSGSVPSHAGELESHVVVCLCEAALSEWYFGDIASCQAGIAQVISLTRELNDSSARALALYHAALAGNLQHDPVDVERVASELIELSTIQNFAHWLALGTVLRGWAHSALGHITEGIAQIEDGIEIYRRNGSVIDLPYLLSLKAEALHLADRSVDALETIREAERLAERSEARWWCAELHRLRGVFLAALGAKESEIETSFETAIRIAKQQSSISLLRRAEASLTEFHSQSGRKNEHRDATDTVTRLSLRSTSPHNPAASCRPAKLGPRKISVSRLPVTGSHIFGREEDIAFLDAAWANQQINVVTVVAWAGVGKSTLVNHWLRRLAAEQYRSAHLVFGWSFYRQGTSGGTSSTDEFIDAALRWFGDPDPRIGTAWEKGERLARLIARRRTLLILDGLEPHQNPPGPQEGRLRDPSLQALLRDLAAFNKGLCVITTRTPVADIADHERTSALRCELEQLSSEAGAKLLRALGVKGHEAELRTASGEFGGHCLALTLLGSYLTDAYKGDIRCRKEVSEHLSHDVRQGVHARKVMESYQAWLGEGPELSVLRALGLFDRPADEKALEVLLKPPAIPGLTESLTDLSPSEWQMILAKLRRARLLAGEDPHNRGQLDTHPLVREYFGEQLRSQGAEAWKESNRRLYNHYRTLAPDLPNSFREMEPLFLAVICGCNAGLFHEALHEVYIPRIQRGNASFAANVLGARGALLSMLAHFFEQGRWGSPVETGVERHSLTADDQLFILIQTALYLTSTRESTPEIRICYERAEFLCHSLGRPLLLYVALIGRWRYSLSTDKLTTTMQVAKRVYSLAQEQNDSRLMIGAHTALAATLYYFGDFETARQHSKRGVQIWRSGGVRVPFEEVDAQPVACLCHDALFEWHFGEIVSCRATMAESISLAKELNDMHGLAVALYYLAVLAYFERNAPEVEHLSSDLIELSTRHNFAHFWLRVPFTAVGLAALPVKQPKAF